MYENIDPGMDGLETYKRILKFHSNQKAIIASGFSAGVEIHGLNPHAVSVMVAK